MFFLSPKFHRTRARAAAVHVYEARQSKRCRIYRRVDGRF